MGAEMGVRNTCMEMAAVNNANPASGLLLGNARNTDAGPLVPLDAGSHTFYILMVFHLSFNDLSFFLHLLTVKLTRTFHELLETAQT